MMRKKMLKLEGDGIIWGIFFLLALSSFFAVYSSITHIAFIHHDGGTFSIFSRHFFYYICGFGILYYTSKINLKYIRNLSLILFPITILLLFYTLTQGVTVGEATRWIRVPFFGTFQPSELAKFVLILLIARNVTVYKNEMQNLRITSLYLILPIVLVCMLILPSNLSTTLLVFLICTLMLFIANFPIKQLLSLFGIGIFTLCFFILFNMTFPNLMPDRVDTWMSRVENFTQKTPNNNYQVEKAKIAIANGGIWGQGPGKSTQKNFLPQSSSDFIYAVIVEEWGIVGGFFILVLYFYLLVRILNIIRKTEDMYLSLVATGMGLAIICQAFINMGVAVNLLPVTGQTLPLVSTGGTSLWITCMAMGIIINISKDIERKKNME